MMPVLITHHGAVQPILRPRSVMIVFDGTISATIEQPEFMATIEEPELTATIEDPSVLEATT